MRNNGIQKNYIKALIIVFSFLMSLLSCGLMFSHTTNAQSESVDANSYQQYDEDFSRILRTYNDWQEEEIVLDGKSYFKENDELFIDQSALESDKSRTSSFVSVKKLGNRYTVVEKEDEVVVSKSAEFNRLIVYSDEALDSYGAIDKAEFGDHHIFQYANAEDTDKAYEYFSNCENVDQVFYDCVVTAQDLEVETNSSYTYQSWGASYVGYEGYVNTMLSKYSQSQLNTVYVVVLDTGINTSHELFTNRIAHKYSKDYIYETSSGYGYEDLNGHGSHVSGTIAEATLSNVKIITMKVLNEEGKGGLSGIIKAIDDAIQYKKSGLNIVALNMSIGVDTSKTTSAQVGIRATTADLSQAVTRAYNAGIVSVVAAGNESQDTVYSSPANVDCAITVSALARGGSSYTGYYTYFDSSYSNYGKYVDFSAPGTAISSAVCQSYYKAHNEKYKTESGTSMATPHVTACVALIYSNPSYTNCSYDDLVTLLQQNSVDMGDSGWDKYYGYGMINIQNIGTLNVGNVLFSETDSFPTEEIELSLSYDTEIETGEVLKIYYSTDESVSTIDPSLSTGLYLYSDSTPIAISKTTKITAAAFVYSSDGQTLIKRSYNSSMVYYYNNIDLESSFEVDSTSFFGGVITKYNGVLTTLNVQSVIDGTYITGIGALAFNSSKVEVLNLPSTIEEIESTAFSGNTTIKEIHCNSSSVGIGSSAFRRCTNLRVFDIENVTSVGTYAFANTTQIEDLYLPYVTNIGSHSLSMSAVKEMVIGQNVSTFANQKDVALTKIYGYAGTVVETFAYNNDIEFVDITLKFNQTLNTRKVLRKSDTLTVTVNYTGLETAWRGTFSGDLDKTQAQTISVDQFTTQHITTITDLAVGKYTLAIQAQDLFGNIVDGGSMQIVVVSDTAQTFELIQNQTNYKIYTDGELVTQATELFKNLDYTFTFVADDGYVLKNLSVNGAEYQNGIVSLQAVSTDLTVNVEVDLKPDFTVTFVTNDRGEVYVDDTVVETVQVVRTRSLNFSITAFEKYVIKSVNVVVVSTGAVTTLTPVDEVYTIENVLNDLNVEINFQEVYYSITVSVGKGGNISSSGGELTNAAHGSNRTFIVSAVSGYVVDFVTINGQIIELDANNSFTIKNVDKDYDIVVSIKKQNDSIFSDENSIILRYFIIFVSLFVVFIIAKIVLTLVRKNKKKRATKNPFDI